MQKTVQREIQKGLEGLHLHLSGDIFTDLSSRLMYATDASAYRELPLAVVRPADSKDIRALIRFARNNQLTLIPRAAGTSLAGQVVGNGIIVDISRYMTKIMEVNIRDKWVVVQPGVVLDELNQFLKPFGLFFAPETSTSNRCMIGGMVGNNASGAHALVYGTTRDHLISIKAVLSDGSMAEFSPVTKEEFITKCQGDKLENKLYRNIRKILEEPRNRDQIIKEFPDRSVIKRNTGYALDLLLESEPFDKSPIGDHSTSRPFNFCKLLAGSEGTLAFITEIKLNLVPLPPREKALVCVHMNSVMEAIKGNLIALEFSPVAVELMDKIILDCTKENISLRKNRFFIKGDPGAVLIVEFAGETKDEITAILKKLEKTFREKSLGYHYPVLFGEEIQKVWDLRNAGLGVLSNLPGDAKPVPVIEDTSVNIQVLEDYISDFQELLERYSLNCVYYAHISVGELHLRPVLNLKDPNDRKKFREIAEETAMLVKKYKGSLSGEHGDGRVRGEFIPIVIGKQNYNLLKEIKKTWDPQNIFNAGKIVDTPPMDTCLKFEPDQPVRDIKTVFDFSDVGGIQRLAEKCNGSGDCRKSAVMGGTMCPSYMATLDEGSTTRARANILREFLTHSPKQNPFDHKEIYEILDLCLSCKGCKSECPSNVDMAKLKAEFLQHYYDANGIPLRTRVIAYIPRLNRLGSIMPGVYNFMVVNSLFSPVFKKILGIAIQRQLPELNKVNFRKWLKKHLDPLNAKIQNPVGKVVLFIDEFTNYNDTEIGIKAVRLLNRLGYRILITDHEASGRTFLSKGLLRKARTLAIKNVKAFENLVDENNPLIGIEPSAILAFRDEYPDLVGYEWVSVSRKLASHVYIIDEFITSEMKKGNINTAGFTKERRHILLHGHCQQKVIASTMSTREMLSFPENYSVEEIDSGCCGMAGSFGYEKEHYDLSMKIGELVLFPAIRKAGSSVIIAAPGTSCRQQITDGTGRQAYHPIEIMFDAMI